MTDMTSISLVFVLGVVFGASMMAATWSHWDAQHTTADCIEAPASQDEVRQ